MTDMTPHSPISQDANPNGANPNGAVTARFVAGRRQYAPEVIERAKMTLADWFAVALGAWDEPAARSVRGLAGRWQARGEARLLLGETTAPHLAALINGTYAHCLDFDDTHSASLAHLSGPTWAAVLALAGAKGLEGGAALDAYITGYEVGARIGSSGPDEAHTFGKTITARGFHSTGVHGRIAAAAAGSALLGLDEAHCSHALGLAITQASGLVASFGTMSKPFHAGKGGMDGVLAVQLAQADLEGAANLLDAPRGLAGTLVQDGSFQMGELEYSAGQELMRVAFKPYAACHLTHSSIDAARQLSGEMGGQDIAQVNVRVNPLAISAAGVQDPQTPLQGKFSLPYCVALAFNGHRANAADFTEDRLRDPAVRGLLARVAMQPEPELSVWTAIMDVELTDGRKLHAEVPHSLGTPDNPMDWQHMETKFMDLVRPRLGADATALWNVLRGFEQAGALAEALQLVRTRS